MDWNLKCRALLLVTFSAICIVGCTKDNGVELDENGEVINPEEGSQIVSGDPSLNTFLITSKDETVYYR